MTGGGVESAKRNLAKKIDHTLLKPEMLSEDVLKLCAEAIEFGFYSVCLPSGFVALAKSKLIHSSVKICAVVGFPLGHSLSEVKAYEANKCVEFGASEIDMVVNIGKLKEGDIDYVSNDIQQVVLSSPGAIVKVIVETHLLTENEILLACQCVVKGGAHFIKTSTGFTGGGATEEDIRLFRGALPPSIKIKASGGIRSLADAQKMISAGADRIGASSGVQILNGLNVEAGAY